MTGSHEDEPTAIQCPCGSILDDGWDEFRAARFTLGPSPGVREAWHRGRPGYLVWLLDVAAGPVSERVGRVARALQKELVPAPGSRLHVTVLVMGFPDELPAHLLRDQIRELEQTRPTAPAVRLHGATSSGVSVHLSVCDCARGIAGIRDALTRCGHSLGFVEPRQSRYRPHVTVGDFPSAFSVESILPALSRHRAYPPLAMHLGRLRLVELDTRSHHAPYLRTHCELALPGPPSPPPTSSMVPPDALA